MDLPKPGISHKNWNPFYSLTWKPHSSTIQTDSDRAEDDQVCFHRQHLSDHVNPWRSTAGYMVPLGHTNKAAHGVKLLPTTVLSWHVHCGCFCVSLKTQRLFLCASGWFNPPSASHLPQTPNPPLPPAHPLYN